MALDIVHSNAKSRAGPYRAAGLRTLERCLLMALSGHFWTARRMSGFVGKADISDACSNVCL
jgi:hypothetical protein